MTEENRMDAYAKLLLSFSQASTDFLRDWMEFLRKDLEAYTTEEEQIEFISTLLEPLGLDKRAYSIIVSLLARDIIFVRLIEYIRRTHHIDVKKAMNEINEEIQGNNLH